MTVAALADSTSRRLSSYVIVRRWESTMVVAALFLSTAAVVPLVFNSSSGSGQTSQLRDPVSQPAWLLIALLLAAAAARHRAEIAASLLRNLPILGLCYLAFLSVLWSQAPSVTLEAAMNLLFGTVLGAYVGVRFGIQGLGRILSWVTAAILLLSVIFVVVVPEYGLDALRDDSWRGVFGTKNEFGRMMVFGAVVWAVRGFARDVSGWWATGMVAAFLVAIVQSGSRTALGVGLLMVGVLVLVWLLSREGLGWVPVKGLIASTLAVVGLTMLVKLELLLALVGADYSLTGRRGIWEAVWSAIVEHPWMGYGYEAFWRGIDGPSLKVWRFSQDFVPHSHNGFLDLVLGLGVVGLAVYLVAMASVWRRALTMLHRATGTMRTFPVVFLSLLFLYNLTESGLLSGRTLPWIVFVAVATALAHADSVKRERPNLRSTTTPREANA